MTIEILKHISALKSDIAAYTGALGRSLVGAVQALLRHDSIAAADILQDLPALIADLHGLEKRCLEIITSRRPVSADLRYIAALLKSAWDLRRIADIVRGIASETLSPAQSFSADHSAALEKFSQSTARLLGRCIEGLLALDQGNLASSSEKFDQLAREQDAFLAQQDVNADAAALSAYLFSVSLLRSLHRIQQHAAGIAGDALEMLQSQS
jgi:phosphate uptake regulator